MKTGYVQSIPIEILWIYRDPYGRFPESESFSERKVGKLWMAMQKRHAYLLVLRFAEGAGAINQEASASDKRRVAVQQSQLLGDEIGLHAFGCLPHQKGMASPRAGP